MTAPAETPVAVAPRYFDPQCERWVVKVLPGGQHVSLVAGNELISTVLGSCVATCMHDPHARIGGMNHFMLPHDDEGLWGGASLALRYGNHAMEFLLNEMIKLGATKTNIVCKVFGGANMMASTQAIGDLNGRFVLEYARRESLTVAASDLGGDRGRRIVFDPASGRAWRRLLNPGAAGALARAERRIYAAPPMRRPAGSVELF